MTRSKKSKLVLPLATLIVGSSALVDAGNALAQSRENVSVFDGGLRGTINTAETPARRSTDDLDLTTANGQRAQLTGRTLSEDPLGGQSAEVPTPTPIPLSPRVQQRAQAATPTPQIFNPESIDQSPRSNIPVDPVQTGEDIIVEDEPFAPTGFRIGVFEADVFLEQSIGYSSNVSQNVDGAGGGFSQTDAALNLISNWSRHELSINLNGSYRRPFDSDEIDQPLFNTDTALRFDLVDGFTLTTSGFYRAQTQEFTSTTLAPGAIDTPLTQAFGGRIELRRDDRKLQFTLSGDIERNVFEEANLGGSVVSQDDLNNLEYGTTLRVGYEVSPAITPYIEGRYAISDFELPRDRNGERRDSEIFELRGGIELDLNEKLQGEIAAGYITQDFESVSLENLDGFTLNGTLNWSPERDTNIALTLGTQTNTSITAGENGSIIYTVGLGAERQITDRWQVSANLDYQLETNDERNTTLELGVGTQYWLNRYLALTANGEYVSFSSDANSSDFDEFSVRAGVRLQR